ncbi:unnamed protein product [Pleuronectes platessa]|uniref:Uncharacterized protein n=1 Tax=Pleuronectes platessa TaxID=8262 RepID=A0A9N7YTZ3_PLEPL|nr:unnamed protein product [Pleuronectes platessa]
MLFSRPTTSCPPVPSTLTSYLRSPSPSLPSILHSPRQTIKQAFPWLTCDSPLPPHHHKPLTEGELQPEIQCGAERSRIQGQNLCPRAFGPCGRSALFFPLLSSSLTGSLRLQTCTNRSHHGPIGGNSYGFDRNKEKTKNV